MYINDIFKGIIFCMFDFLVPLVDFCDCHSSSKEEKRVLKGCFFRTLRTALVQNKKAEGTLGLLEVLTGKVNTCIYFGREEDNN